MRLVSKCCVLLLTLGIFIPSLSADNTKNVTIADSFIFFADQFRDEVPESYQYLHLNFYGIPKDSQLEDSLQILLYKDLIKNIPQNIYPNKLINIYGFEQLSREILGVGITDTNIDANAKTRLMQQSDLDNVQYILDNRDVKTTIKFNVSLNNQIDVFGKQGKILEDVYQTLRSEYYNQDAIIDQILIQGAIKGLTQAVGDRYTSYFPPIESSEFISALDGEFEGIGAYIDMPTPGELIIISPISGSPAETAGIKGGDRILKVDEKQITENNPMSEVISWIKGPAGTIVTLTIQREGNIEPLILQVTRERIIINDIEYSKPNRTTAYIEIKSFGEKVDSQFKDALEEIANDNSIRKIIFDVRNNPGGYLQKVSNMLGYILPKNSVTAIVHQGDDDLEYKSKGQDIIDINKYKIIILQNGGSASASEIFTGTLKDYYSEITILGEQSFGKGSVQTLKNYYDGSTLKYTTAKWFTGKTRIGIDGIGITPDKMLLFDTEKWSELKIDNQLNQALNM